MPRVRRVPVVPCLLALMLGWTGGAPGAAPSDVPEQFRVWGTRAAAHPYLGDPGLAGPGSSEVAATGEEKERGFLVFAWPAAELVCPDFDLASDARCAALSAADCPGQYGPVTFAVLALGAGEFSVTVTDLESGGGAKIPASHLDVRAVRYARVTYRKEARTIPLLLEKSGRTAVAARRIQQFWITYHVPEGAAAGTYEGKVRILLGGEEKLALPLRLTVYPFRLGEPDTDLYIYYNNSKDAAGLDLVRKELADQRCHGMTLSTLDPPVTHDGDLTREALAPLLDAYKEAGLASRRVYVGLWNRITSEWLNEPDKSIKMYGAWFRYYPFSETLDKRYVETVKMIREEAVKRGLGLILQVADEAGSHPWTIPATQHYLDLVRREVPGVLLELTCGGGWAMGFPEETLWHGRLDIWNTNRWLTDKLAIVRKNEPKAEIGVYNMAGGGSTPGGLAAARAFYGVFAWKSKARGAAQWTYWYSGTPEDNYTWPSERPGEGRVPTLRWEAAREGAKDLRYLALLEARLKGARGPAADEARALLAEIAEKTELRTGDYDPITGGRIPAQPAATYDAWRARAAALIGKLKP